MTHVPKSHRPTSAVIDLGALEHNYRSASAFVGEGVAVMAVVKSDAYGHGAVECAKRLEACGTAWLATALVEEAIELREAKIATPILCLGGCWPGQSDAALRHNVTPVVFDLDQAREMNRAAEARGTMASVHVKIDTGMGRVGVPFLDAAEFARKLATHSNLRVDGMMTHFAAADDLDEKEFTEGQIERFGDVVAKFREAGHDPTILDLANSPGAVVYPDSRSCLVRLGGILYGLGGDILPRGVPKPDLRPVMSLKATIGQVKDVPVGETLGYGRSFTTRRDSRIATIGIGYHDGLPRSLSNAGNVIVRGIKVPIVGRISMDWTIVDVTDVAGVERGDQATVIGSDGDMQILAEDIAAIAGTISYEVTCGISRRVPKTYQE